MTDLLAYITWDVNPNIIESPLMVRYYGLLWAVSFFVGLFLMKKMMKNDNAPDDYTDKIFIYVMIGSVLGARLGHVVFYDPDYYFTAAHWTEIPMIWKGGLASHGGLIGVVLAIFLYSRKVSKKSFLWAADKVVVTVAIAACLIRVGNLMNSEIIGRESDSSIAVFFKDAAQRDVANEIGIMTDGQLKANSVEITPDPNVDTLGLLKVNVSSQGMLNEGYINSLINGLKKNHSLSGGFKPSEDHIAYLGDESQNSVLVQNNNASFTFQVKIIPRIPTQIWEAGSYLIIFILLFWGYWSQKWYRKEGFLFGLFLILLFGARFIIEFWKEHQTVGDEALLNMGQWLSIPAVVFGLIVLVRAIKNPEVETKISTESTN